MNASVKRLEETGTALRDALTQQDWSAIGMLDRLTHADELEDFLTLPAYRRLD